MTQPACMTDAEYALWSKANAALTPSSRAGAPCFDCPVAFALEMRAEGCCNGVPGGAGGRPRKMDSPERMYWREKRSRYMRSYREARA